MSRAYTRAMLRLRHLAPLVVAVAAACTSKASGEQVEKKIQEWATSQNITLTKTTCPKTIKVEVNTVFDCQVTVDNGEELTIRGTITSKSGKNFEYSIKPVEATYFTEKLTGYLDEALTQQVGVKPKSVTCGAPGLHKVPAELKVMCSATDPQGIATPIAITFAADGTVSSWAAQ